MLSIVGLAGLGQELMQSIADLLLQLYSLDSFLLLMLSWYISLDRCRGAEKVKPESPRDGRRGDDRARYCRPPFVLGSCPFAGSTCRCVSSNCLSTEWRIEFRKRLLVELLAYIAAFAHGHGSRCKSGHPTLPSQIVPSICLR